MCSTAVRTPATNHSHVGQELGEGGKNFQISKKRSKQGFIAGGKEKTRLIVPVSVVPKLHKTKSHIHRKDEQETEDWVSAER